MRYGILGPLEVMDDAGARLDLGTPRQRAVLAILVIHANRVVSLDRLIDELWGEAPPSAATSSLQAYVSNLRRILEPDRAPRTPATVLVSEAPGYVLRCAPETVDTLCFEHDAGVGRAGLDDDPATARTHLERALARWRGNALPDFVYEPFALAEIARLHELRAGVEEDLVDAMLACNDVNAAVVESQRLASAEPLRERRRAQQMIALYRGGRQVDALRAYEEMRVTLADELGLDPSPALQQLHQDVLDQAVDLGSGPPIRATAPAPEPAAAPTSAPAAAPTPDGPPFVGRARPLAELHRVLDDGDAGRNRIVVVTGDAGIGKTRLIQEMAGRAEARGWLVAWGRCHDDEGAPPMWPWTQSLRTLLAAGADPAITADVADDLAALLPELGGHVIDAPADDSARFRQYDAVMRLVCQLTDRRPVLIVLDDVHWADSSSLRLLRFLATYVRSARLAVVVTAREHEGSRPELLTETIADLVRQTGSARLSLDPLDADAVRAYVEQVGAGMPGHMADAVHARTDGNPFFVSELVKLLVSESGRGGKVAEVPAAVGDVIRRRIARLPDDTQALLRVAAVSGRTFDIDTVAHACRLDDDEAFDRIEPALLTGVIAADGGALRFSHALVSEAIEADLSSLRRARLHLELAHALVATHERDLDAHLTDVGRHLEAAGTLAGTDEVIEYARREAEVATNGLAFEEAVIARERVVAALDRAADVSDRDRLDALVALGIARLQAGDLGGARAMQDDLLELAERVGDVELLAVTALAFQSRSGTQWRSWRVVSDAMVRALERVVSELPPGDSEVRCRALSALGLELHYDEARRNEGIACALEAVAMAERIGTPALLAHALHGVIAATKVPDQLPLQLATARRLAALDVAPDLIASGRVDELRCELRAGTVENFGARVHALVDDAEQRRDPALRTLLAWAETTVAFFAGELAAAERHAFDAAARHERLGAWGGLEALGIHLGLIYREMGRLTEVIEPLDKMIDKMAPAEMLILRAMAAVGQGDLDRARELFPLAPQSAGWDYTWLTYTCSLAYVASAIDAPLTAELYDLLLPFRGEVAELEGSFVSFGSTEFSLGLLARALDRPDAAEHLAAAVIANDRIGALPWATRARLALSELHAATAPAESSRLLDEAEAAIATTELVVLREEIAALRASLTQP